MRVFFLRPQTVATNAMVCCSRVSLKVEFTDIRLVGGLMKGSFLLNICPLFAYLQSKGGVCGIVWEALGRVCGRKTSGVTEAMVCGCAEVGGRAG